MALNNASKTYNTFVKGIITEASPLTFPENASSDEANFVLNIDGSRQRRLGIDYEENYATSGDMFAQGIISTDAITVSDWFNAGNDGSKSFLVVQISNLLYFYESRNQSISSVLHATKIDLADFQTTYATNIGVEPIQVAVGNGILYIVSKDTEPFRVVYDAALNTITTSLIYHEVRDFVGLDDNLTTTQRAASLSQNHAYNLANQGWDEAGDDWDTYKILTPNVYPSNADIWFLGKDTNDVFDAATLNKAYVGNTPAPKGHFIQGVFIKVSPAVGFFGASVSSTEERRFSTVGFYSGRVWYSGVESKLVANVGEPINGHIYYSQILTDSGRAGKCYQEADPTSEEISDLIATDGGVINIPEIERVWKLIPLRNSLLVFCSNGVWQIRGGGDTGFDATNFEVLKITSIGVFSADTIIIVEDNIMFWADSGIYAMSSDASGAFTTVNITTISIKTLYNNIGNVAKLYAKGSYDHVSKIVSWLYNDAVGFTGANDRYKYDTELLFNTQLQAFSKNTFSSITATSSPSIHAPVITKDLITQNIAYTVVSNGADVEANTDPVVVTTVNPANGNSAIKYLTLYPTTGDGTFFRVTFSELSNTGFVDWYTRNTAGKDFVSFLNTGQEIFGDTHKTKQVKYLTMHFERTETGFTTIGGGIEAVNPSSCLIQSKWGWSDHSNSNRYGTQFQAYRLRRLYIPTSDADPYNYGFEVITTKSKLRGHGKALSITITSEAGKDMHILGWSVDITGETD